MPALDSKAPASLQAPITAATNRAADAMRVAVAREYAKPAPTISVVDARFIKECCDSTLAATDPADPRYYAVWAQSMRAHRDLMLIQQTNRKAIKANIRQQNKRELEYWRARLAM